MKKLFDYFKAWRYLRRVSRATGDTMLQVQSSAYFFHMNLTELAAYDKFFGRFPDPEYKLVIRHMGVDNLINQVKQQMATVPVEN